MDEGGGGGGVDPMLDRNILVLPGTFLKHSIAEKRNSMLLLSLKLRTASGKVPGVRKSK